MTSAFRSTSTQTRTSSASEWKLKLKRCSPPARVTTPRRIGALGVSGAHSLQHHPRRQNGAH
eukprot:2769636-Pyramimonas_sp.AAC.1